MAERTPIPEMSGFAGMQRSAMMGGLEEESNLGWTKDMPLFITGIIIDEHEASNQLSAESGNGRKASRRP